MMAAAHFKLKLGYCGSSTGIGFQKLLSNDQNVCTWILRSIRIRATTSQAHSVSKHEILYWLISYSQTREILHCQIYLLTYPIKHSEQVLSNEICCGLFFPSIQKRLSRYYFGYCCRPNSICIYFPDF